MNRPHDAPKRTGWQRVPATVVRGHGVASGRGTDPRYPDGTLALQLPHFRAHGLDLSSFYRGTLNVSIAPCRYEVRQPKLTVRQVRWTDHVPPEDFSFFDCRIRHRGRTTDGLIYYPHPETKPEHEQPDDVLEVLAPRLNDLHYGDALVLLVDPAQLHITRSARDQS